MCVSINGPGDLDLDLETGVQVASKVGNLPSKFGHARPLDSRIIRHVRDGLMDRQKQRLLPPPPTGGGIITMLLGVTVFRLYAILLAYFMCGA